MEHELRLMVADKSEIINKLAKQLEESQKQVRTQF